MVRLFPYIDQAPLFNQLNMVTGYGALWGNNGQWTVPVNGSLTTTSIPVAICPSDSQGFPGNVWNGFSVTNYDGSAGSEAFSNNGPGNNYPAPPALINTWGDGTDPTQVSGMGTRGGPSLGMKDVSDGTSNVILMGEIIPRCNDHAGNRGLWSENGTSFHAGTAAAINDFTPCPWVQPAQVRFPNCKGNLQCWNEAWAFRSFHVGGAQFLFVDGSVHFLSENLNYLTYQYLGGRSDGNVIGDY